ncbi:MAG TPA: hypothetical protein VFA12_01750 [Stellaceae bacterium]|nr:hypothetical protein [Stellaceae bacterium]
MTPEDQASPNAARDGETAPNETASESDPEFAELIAAAEREADIPFAAFAAVAELLSYLYRLDTERGGHDASV